jgi:hypothetical protein
MLLDCAIEHASGQRPSGVLGLAESAQYGRYHVDPAEQAASAHPSLVQRLL